MRPGPVTVCVTSSFPFGDGEQFLESELPHWSDAPGRLMLLPEKTEGLPRRDVPDTVEVRTHLAERWDRRPAQLRSAAAAVVSPMLRRELVWLARGRLLSRYRVTHAALSVTRVEMVVRELGRLAADLGGPIDTLYAYWMSVSAFAGVLAKDAGLVRHVVARAHGTDLYPGSRPQQYTALVRQVAPRLDRLYPISDDGARVAREAYGFRPDQVEVARLGVRPALGPCPASPPGELSVVSVSALRPLKQVHLIASAVSEVARRRPDLQVRWTHAGTGELRAAIDQQVDRELALPNLTVEMLGHVPNADLLAWYRTHPVDLFVNASTTEGVPVSIMEAMAHGIPAIAPAVGAVDEIVPPELLLPAPATASAIAERVLAYADTARDAEFRAGVTALQRARYDAEANYAAFVAGLVDLGRLP